MAESFEQLEATYGPAAPFSEHKRGEHLKYLRADGMASEGEIVWIQAAYQDIRISLLQMITAFWTLHFHWMYSPRTSRQPETGNLITYCKDRLTPHSTCHALRVSLFALPCFPWVYNGLCGRVVSFSRSTSSIVGARNERTAFRSGSPRG